MNQEPLDKLPVYRCHKEVRASKILEIKQSPPDVEIAGGSYDLVCTDATVTVPDGFVQKHSPQVGGYFVVYEDGYVSYSPAKAFEDGYTVLDDIKYRPTDAVEHELLQQCAANLIEMASLPKTNGDGMSFGQALESLKRGVRVARSGWNGKGMWLSLSGDGTRSITADKFWSKNNAEFAEANGGSAPVLPCITMKTATGEILMGWLASQTDMLAEDWAEV